MEEWKTIKENSRYSVSSIGRVRNNKTGRIIKLSQNESGYLKVGLHANGKHKRYFVSRLLASSFLGEIPEGFIVDHINRIRNDNRLENLRIVTPKENSLNKTYNHLRYLIEKIVKMSKDGKSIDDIVSTLGRLRNI